MNPKCQACEAAHAEREILQLKSRDTPEVKKNNNNYNFSHVLSCSPNMETRCYLSRGLSARVAQTCSNWFILGAELF